MSYEELQAEWAAVASDVNYKDWLASQVIEMRHKCYYAELSDSALSAVRRVLKENNVPAAAFIDDHVGNAIWQRNEAWAAGMEAAAAVCDKRAADQKDKALMVEDLDLAAAIRALAVPAAGARGG